MVCPARSLRCGTAVVGGAGSDLRREKAAERGERERREHEYNDHGRVVIDGVRTQGLEPWTSAALTGPACSGYIALL